MKTSNEIKDCKVAWVPVKDQHLTEQGVRSAGGHFVGGDFTYDKAGMVAAQLSLNNDASGDYIAVYS